MIFGKHINRYYLRFAPLLLCGLAALVAVDYLQLLIPNLYQMVINGINDGFVVMDGVQVTFDLAFVVEEICLPMLAIIMSIVAGRFLWRICFSAPASGRKKICVTGCLVTARNCPSNFITRTMWAI